LGYDAIQRERVASPGAFLGVFGMLYDGLIER